MMASKRKKSTSEGPVKIVGINHGVCLHLFLLMDGWKKEQFTDVTFFCQSSDTFGQQPSLQNKLRANRSVLAASSPFFAALLPDCELELDVCISIDLNFEEMFCVLEYIYSGKLLCSIDSKDRILSILKEFDIFVPNYLHSSSCNEKNDAEVEIIIEEAIERNECRIDTPEASIQDIPVSSILSSNNLQMLLGVEELTSSEKIVPASSTGSFSISEEKFLNKNQIAVKMYSNKSKCQHNSKESNGDLDLNSSRILDECEHSNIENPLSDTAVQLNSPTDSLTKNVNQINSTIQTNCTYNELKINGNCYQDDWTVKRIPNKETVTLQLPSQFLSGSMSCTKKLENNVIKRSVGAHFHSSTYPLSLYHSHTWCYGIYRPFEPDIEAPEIENFYDPLTTMNKGQGFVHNWTSFRQPTFLVSRPLRVYTRREVLARERPNHNKAVLKLTDIRDMKVHKGKIHVTLNGHPIVQPALPQLFHSGEDYCKDQPGNLTQSQTRVSRRSTTTTHGIESDDDKIDLALAKHFLQEEVRTKQKLQMKIRMFSERLSQSKQIARTILRRTKEMRLRKRENEAAKLLPLAKKSGPQTQCEQCGKMVLASRLSIHLKIHSGVKSHLCDLCGRAFLLKAYLNAHIRINHRGTERPKRFMCSSCGYTCDQKHKLEVHERVHTDERPFDCQYCNKKFREKGTLVRHIRTHTGEKPYACNICGTSYAARDTYVQHYRRKHEQHRSGSANEPRSRARHSNVVVYRCEFCQKGFYRILAYEKHRASHTGVAAAVRCTQGDCNFTYSDMTQLKDHMAICHPGKTYTCTVCSKVFLTKQNLANHQSKHDPTLGFHCSYCSMSLTTKASLIAHEKIHTRDKPYECSYCGMRFHSPYLIKIHLRKHQPTQPKRKRVRRPIEEASVTAEVDSVSDATAEVAYY